MRSCFSKFMILLIFLNTCISNVSFTEGNPIITAPMLIDIQASGAVFGLETNVAGTLYYVVTPYSDMTLTAEDIVTYTSAGAITLDILAVGTVPMTPPAMTFTIENLEGCTSLPADTAYVLWTTYLADGLLAPATQTPFNPIVFTELPHVVNTTLDQIVVNCKTNAPGTLYYGIYPDASAVTAEDVIAQGHSVALNEQLGWASTITFGELSPVTTYDLVFVRVDAFNHYYHTPYVLNDVKTKGNKLIYATLTYDNSVWTAHYHFTEPITDYGQTWAYSLFMDSHGVAMYGTNLGGTPSITGNIVSIPITDQTFLTALNQEIAEYEVIPVTFMAEQNAGIQPKLNDGYQAPVYSFLERFIMEQTAKPFMLSGTYVESGAAGASDDYFTVQLSKPLTDTSDGLSFFMDVHNTSNTQTLAWLDLTTDFNVVQTSGDVLTFTFTEAGANKLDNLPNSLIRIVLGSSPHALNAAVPNIYIRRDGSSTQLSSLTLNNIPVANFSPSLTEYGLTLPYKLLEKYQHNPSNLIGGTPTSGDSYVRYVRENTGQGQLQVVAPNGSTESYYINCNADPLTLGGVLINDHRPLESFDYYAVEQHFSVSDVIEPLPTFTALHAYNVGATVIASPSAVFVNTYDYHITLNFDGATRDYLISITYEAAPPPEPPAEEPPITPPAEEPPTTPPAEEPPTTPPAEEPPTTPPAEEPPTTPPAEEPPTTPPPDNTYKIVKETDDISPPTTVTATEKIEAIQIPVTKLLSNLEQQTNSTELFTTLSTVGEVINNMRLELNKGTETDSLQSIQLISTLTTITAKTEEKLQTVKDPANQLLVLDQLVTQVRRFKMDVTAPTHDLDRSIEDMIQNTANAFGTIQLVKGSESQITINSQQLDFVLKQQTEAINRLNQLQQNYFENSAPRQIQKVLKIEATLPDNQAKLNIVFDTGQIQTLKRAEIQTLAVSNQNAEINLPINNFNTPQDIAVSIVAVINEPPTATNVSAVDGPQLVYEVALTVNNEQVDAFQQPITLKFNLTAFNLQQEAPETLAIFKRNVETGQWEAVGGKVDPESNSIYVTRDNLSQYTVMKSKKSFSDADQSWAKTEINAMLNKGIVSEASEFKPQALLTRGEFASWIAKAYGLKMTTANLPFKDVKLDSENYNAIAAAYQHGLLNGKNKTKFDPSAPLSQNELAAAMSKLLVNFDQKEKSGKVTSKYLANLKTTQVASWAEDDMALLMELGFNANGNGDASVTKEAAAAVFMKFYKS